MRSRVEFPSRINHAFQSETCCGFAQLKKLKSVLPWFCWHVCSSGKLATIPNELFIHSQGLIRDVDVARITVECFPYFWDSS